MKSSRLLIACMLLSGFCGIMAELSLFNLGSLLIGGTNHTLLMTMGLMMFAMGFGSWLSGRKYFQRVSWDMFAFNEMLLSLLCMLSVSSIYWIASHEMRAAGPLLMIWSLCAGTLIGLEIPLILRLNEKLGTELQENSAMVLMADYFGSLLAFTAFPFLFLPQWGLHLTAWSGGLMNLLLALTAFIIHFHRFQYPKSVTFGALICIGVAIGGFGSFERLKEIADARLYRDPIVLDEHSELQSIVITQKSRQDKSPWAGRKERYKSLASLKTESVAYEIRQYPDFQKTPDIRLYLNGGLQFSTIDEYRYHEMLVHPAAQLASSREQALILGGGDGMAARELLKYPDLASIVLVDPDHTLVELFRYSNLASLNEKALQNPKVTHVADDAFHFLLENPGPWPIMIVDFPDPHHLDTARLYSEEFYLLAHRSLADGGCMAVQSTSPLFNRKVFGVIKKTMTRAGFEPLSLQVSMKSFEDWGFQMACKGRTPQQIQAGFSHFDDSSTRWLNREVLEGAWRFGKGMFHDWESLPINEVNRPILPGLYSQAM